VLLDKSFELTEQTTSRLFLQKNSLQTDSTDDSLVGTTDPSNIDAGATGNIGVNYFYTAKTSNALATNRRSPMRSACSTRVWKIWAN